MHDYFIIPELTSLSNILQMYQDRIHLQDFSNPQQTVEWGAGPKSQQILPDSAARGCLCFSALVHYHNREQFVK